MSSGVTIKGIPELRMKLARLSNVDRQEVAERALGQGGEMVAEDAKSRVSVRTGKLRDSIEWAYARESDVHTVRVGPSARTRASRKDGFYGLFLETGTGPRQTKAGANRGAMPPRPFLRPALDSQQGSVIATVRRVLGEEIEKLAK